MVGRDRMSHVAYRDPPIRGLSVVQATLRIFVALECWGAAVGRLVSGHTSDLSRLLQKDFSVPAGVAGTLDQSVAWCLLICGFVTLVRPVWPVLLAVTVCMLLQPAAVLMTGYGVLPRLEFAREAIRWTAPIALLLTDFWPPPLPFTYTRFQMAMMLLRLSVVATFLAYGAHLIHHAVDHGSMAELLVAGVARLRIGTLSPAQSHFALGLIGGLQMGIGLSLLVSQSRPAAFLATIVGMAAAALPTIARGTHGYHETLFRMIDGGAPLALLACWTLGFEEFPPKPIPAGHHRDGHHGRFEG